MYTITQRFLKMVKLTSTTILCNLHAHLRLYKADNTFFNPRHSSRVIHKCFFQQRRSRQRVRAITGAKLDFNCFFFSSFSHVLGSDGRTADKRTDSGAGVVVRNVRSLYHLSGVGAHLRADDKHVSIAQRRSHKQTPGLASRDRIAAREDARLHRVGLGFFHGTGTVSLSRRGGYSLLGQILGLFLHRRHR